MRFITLTSDMGYTDPYRGIAAMEANQTGLDIKVIELACNLYDKSIKHAAYVLKSALTKFPENSIHLFAVKNMESNLLSKNDLQQIDNTRYLITKLMGQYILTPDNGLFTLLDKNFKEDVFQLYYSEEKVHQFFLLDVFIPVAKLIIQNTPLHDFASLTKNYYKTFEFEPYKTGNILKGRGIYYDDYGNIITNITKQTFENEIGNNSFKIQLPRTEIINISNTYNDVELGKALVLFNTNNYLEVAINGASAYKMLHPREIGTKFEFNLMIEIEE
ncbi:MAG: SAM-dependent chlorinase/fluorinase [Bacteroidetes bacterium]|nr:SAM-dependent chlorinase/fluorinase [Bacteroidota bacterium]